MRHGDGTGAAQKPAHWSLPWWRASDSAKVVDSRRGVRRPGERKPLGQTKRASTGAILSQENAAGKPGPTAQKPAQARPNFCDHHYDGFGTTCRRCGNWARGEEPPICPPYVTRYEHDGARLPHITTREENAAAHRAFLASLDPACG